MIITTPEKWDGISRSWQTREYVRDVSLIVIDEIHLLGEERGPVLEVIVSRTNFISSNTGRKIRIIGLSTALANAKDLGNWLGIGQMGLFNFKPSVRPVPLSVNLSFCIVIQKLFLSSKGARFRLHWEALLSKNGNNESTSFSSHQTILAMHSCFDFCVISPSDETYGYDFNFLQFSTKNKTKFSQQLSISSHFWRVRTIRSNFCTSRKSKWSKF